MKRRTLLGTLLGSAAGAVGSLILPKHSNSTEIISWDPDPDFRYYKWTFFNRSVYLRESRKDENADMLEIHIKTKGWVPHFVIGQMPIRLARWAYGGRKEIAPLEFYNTMREQMERVMGVLANTRELREGDWKYDRDEYI